jgi:hypothetical protein
LKKILFAVLVTVAALCVVPTARAEGNFANHLDLLQASTARGGNVTIADFGCHFTVFRVFNRAQLFGAGVMLDLFGEPGYPNGSIKGNFLVTVPILDVALQDPDDVTNGEPWLSLGARYGYNLNTKDHGVVVGFSFSFR